MNEGEILRLAQEGVKTILMASAPMLGFGLIVGLLVSIFQATTQIQEATLAFIPKIVAVLVSFIFFGPWILKLVLEFTQNLLMNLNLYIQ
ncbi:flagellar biosynthesis protein FliQ [Sporosalibacterium faouarense]|uniref:flagellar biosynthesis protein FliQ n=1 Tax=Sporosalibacterium faouarense TaxID=516123 RepID=UPI00141C2D7F|nr:flagellar biosynthesis protein FliQ [Sporosalibacterium faouarense]MTI48005.1 flagellar biosynthesis protein FliQ [Bacillota bacterium]